MVILFCLFLKCRKLVYNKVVAQCGFFVGGIDETLARKNWANQFSLCLSCVRKFEKVLRVLPLLLTAVGDWLQSFHFLQQVSNKSLKRESNEYKIKIAISRQIFSRFN